MGAGQFVRRQFVKGGLFALAQVAFTLMMALGGAKRIAQLFSGDLGTRLSGEIWNEQLQIYEKVRGDNSFLILLYGVGTLLLTALYAYLWYQNVKDSYASDLLLCAGDTLPTAGQDFSRFLNEKFHIPLLIFPLLGLLVFTVLPFVFMVLIAFTNYD